MVAVGQCRADLLQCIDRPAVMTQLEMPKADVGTPG